MIFKALQTIKKYNMLEHTDKIVVGLSGGADSVALAYFLYNVSLKEKIDLIAVHVNHGLRGEESDRDEEFVKRFCYKTGINLLIKKADINFLSKQYKTGTEETGRKIRYEAFEEATCGNSKAKIATAHTLSDNTETMIMHLISGCSLKGLCGIPAVRGNIIRPFIDVSRKEIENYCMENNLSYINDSSNFEENYTRNKIRLSVIPILKNINPDFENTVNRTVKLLSQDEKYLSSVCNEMFMRAKTDEGFNINKIKNLPCSVRSRVIFKIIRFFSSQRIEHKHVELVNKLIDFKINALEIPGGGVLICKNNILQLKDESNSKNIFWEYPIKPLNVLTESESTIIIKVVSISEYEDFKKNSHQKNYWALDFNKLNQKNVLRNRREGDVFTFPFRNISKSVKKIFNEMKIPLNLRNKIAILASDNNIVWIDKIGVSKNYILTEKTQKIAIIIKE